MDGGSTLWPQRQAERTAFLVFSQATHARLGVGLLLTGVTHGLQASGRVPNSPGSLQVMVPMAVRTWQLAQLRGHQRCGVEGEGTEDYSVLTQTWRRGSWLQRQHAGTPPWDPELTLGSGVLLPTPPLPLPLTPAHSLVLHTWGLWLTLWPCPCMPCVLKGSGSSKSGDPTICLSTLYIALDPASGKH